jgi:hypothetical protein
MSADREVRLFSNGTLQSKPVQIATFGRELTGEPDALPGFVRDMVEIRDALLPQGASNARNPR